jgi:hypothetical protein
MEVKWTQCRESLPTEADADEFGDIFWCGQKYVRREPLIIVLSWDFTRDWNLNGYWARTGFKYPIGPTIK